MLVQSQEAWVILAIEAIQSTEKLSHRAAAKLYNIPESILCDRMNRQTILMECRPANTLLTEIEKDVIV